MPPGQRIDQIPLQLRAAILERDGLLNGVKARSKAG